MKKLVFTFLVLLCIGLCGFTLAGCAKTYKINIEKGSERDIDKCPQRAAAGETVTLYTVVVADGELFLNVSGADVKKITEGVYEFVMPAQDVTISTYISTAGFPGS